MSYNNIFGGPSYGQDPAPSIYGALPYPTPALPVNFVTFYFTTFDPDVLNCIVLGPQQTTYFTVITDPNMPTYTVLKDAKARSIGLVEWSSPAHVELRGSLTKRKVKDWLKLSRDKLSRTMDVGGIKYVWVPKDQHINLYSSLSFSQLVARISRGQNTVTLDISTEAIRLGMLDCTVMATLILQSGKNIE